MLQRNASLALSHLSSPLLSFEQNITTSHHRLRSRIPSQSARVHVAPAVDVNPLPPSFSPPHLLPYQSLALHTRYPVRSFQRPSRPSDSRDRRSIPFLYDHHPRSLPPQFLPDRRLHEPFRIEHTHPASTYPHPTFTPSRELDLVGRALFPLVIEPHHVSSITLRSHGLQPWSWCVQSSPVSSSIFND